MQRKVRVIALMLLCAGALAACHKKSQAPLAFVPADTPYVIANLKPIDEASLKSMLAQANLQMKGQMAQIRAMAGELADTSPKGAAVLRVIADEFDNRNIQQVAQHIGVDQHALMAIYGEGLSPVARIQIADKARFNAFLARLEKASGMQLENAKLGKLAYRQLSFGTKHRMQFIVSLQSYADGKKSRAILALLPANRSKSMLREVLGLTRPKKTLLASGKLSKLATAKGYLPISVGYVDFTRLPALIAGGKDPLMKTLMAADPKLAGKLPASCQADLARVAARMPMISTGYTALSDKRRTQRTDIALAPDITKAFDGVAVKLPGLHGDMVAPLDFAMAVPIKEMRAFWIAQADAVTAKPFTCPALTSLNASFPKMRVMLQRSKMPPINDIRGIRISLDEVSMPQAGTKSMPKIAGRVMIASDNPAALLAMAQMALPMLRDVQLNTDGKPVAMPDKLIALAGGAPIWAAMTNHVLAVAYGDGEDKRIATDLKNDVGAPGDVMNMVMDGSMLRKWVKMIADRSLQAMQNMPSSDDPATETRRLTRLQEARQRMQGMQEQLKQLDSATAKGHVDAHGIVFVNDVHMR